MLSVSLTQKSITISDGYCRWGNPFERVALWVSALRLLSRDEADAEANMATLARFQEFAGGEVPVGGLRFDLTAESPVPERMVEAATIAAGGDAAAGLEYLRNLVVEASVQVLGEDSVDEL